MCNGDFQLSHKANCHSNAGTSLERVYNQDAHSRSSGLFGDFRNPGHCCTVLDDNQVQPVPVKDTITDKLKPTGDNVLD